MFIENKKNKLNGFSLVEILVSISIFLIFVITLSDIDINTKSQIKNANNRERASFLAEEGLEAVRNIRDDNFSNLIDGSFGISSSSNVWNFSGSSDMADIFTRQINILTINPTQKQITATVSWNDQILNSNSVVLTTYLTDWKKVTASCNNMANCLSVGTSGISTIGNVQITGITLTNNSTTTSTIDKMTVSWTGGASNNRIVVIRINGINYWTGSQTSGTLLDITNFNMITNTTYPLNYLEFSRNIKNATLSIIFTMTDGSTKTVSGILVP